MTYNYKMKYHIFLILHCWRYKYNRKSIKQVELMSLFLQILPKIGRSANEELWAKNVRLMITEEDLYIFISIYHYMMSK